MKKLVKVEEVSGEGLIALMGENVELYCLNYIYTGKLIGVNDRFVKLESPRIVYETGDFSDKKFKDAQNLGNDLYVMIQMIESFKITNKT